MSGTLEEVSVGFYFVVGGQCEYTLEKNASFFFKNKLLAPRNIKREKKRCKWSQSSSCAVCK